MAITEGRFNRLEERVNDAIERVIKVEAAPPGGTPAKISWGKIVSAASPVVALFALGVGLIYHLDDRISHLDEKMSDPKAGIAARLDKVESAVKTIASQQSDQTRKLIRDLLATAENTDRPEVTVKATSMAASLTGTLRKDRYAAPPDFFRSSIEA